MRSVWLSAITEHTMVQGQDFRITKSRNHAILATTIRGHDHLCFCAINGRSTTTYHYSMPKFYKHRAADISPVLIDAATEASSIDDV